MAMIIRLNPTACLYHIIGPISVVVFFVSSGSQGKWAGLFMLCQWLKLFMIFFALKYKYKMYTQTATRD